MGIFSEGALASIDVFATMENLKSKIIKANEELSEVKYKFKV